MNRNLAIAVCVIAVVAVVSVVAVHGLADEDEGEWVADGRFSIDVQTSSELGIRIVGWNYEVRSTGSGYEMRVSAPGVNSTIDVNENGLSEAAFPVTGMLHGMYVTGTESIQTASGEKQCDVWVDSEDWTMRAWIGSDDGVPYQTQERYSGPGYSGIETRTLRVSDLDSLRVPYSDAFLDLRGGLQVGDWYELTVSGPDGGSVYRHSVVGIDGVFLTIDIDGQETTVNAVDAFPYFCMPYGYDLQIVGTETIDTPFGEKQCDVYGYGDDRYWVHDGITYMQSITNGMGTAVTSLTGTSLLG